MNRRTILSASLLALCATLNVDAKAASVVLDSAVPTMNLAFGSTLDAGTPQNLAWDPTNGQYYGATGGAWSDTGYVWDAGGNLLQARTPIGLDVRALDYDPASNALEVVTFDAGGAPAPAALLPLTRDGQGLITGVGSTPVLGLMPGVADAQSAPAYDAAGAVYYSLGSQSDPSTAGVVNVVSRADGSLARQIALDLAHAGGAKLQGEFIGYDAGAGVLVGLDAARTRALVFNSRDGTFLGGCALPSIPTGGIGAGFGYTHGQLFVFDGALKEYRGYDVLNPAAVPEPSAAVLLTVGALALWVWRRRRDVAGAPLPA